MKYGAFMDENQQNLTPADTVYKWTIRSLYTAAITLNVYFLYQQYKDTEGGKDLKAKFDKARNEVTKPWRERKHFRTQANETLVEAWIIVDEAQREQEEKDKDAE
jgi:hypothetical protein